MNYQNSDNSHRPNKTVMIVFPTKLTNAVNSISKTFLSLQDLLDKIVGQNVFYSSVCGRIMVKRCFGTRQCGLCTKKNASGKCLIHT